jgi:hypothetical protein
MVDAKEGEIFILEYVSQVLLHIVPQNVQGEVVQQGRPYNDGLFLDLTFLR